MVPYRTMYPNASEKEWKLKNAPMERYLRTLQLINPAINLAVVCKDEDAKDDSSGNLILCNCGLCEVLLNKGMFRFFFFTPTVIFFLEKNKIRIFGHF